MRSSILLSVLVVFSFVCLSIQAPAKHLEKDVIAEKAAKSQETSGIAENESEEADEVVDPNIPEAVSDAPKSGESASNEQDDSEVDGSGSGESGSQEEPEEGTEAVGGDSNPASVSNVSGESTDNDEQKAAGGAKKPEIDLKLPARPQLVAVAHDDGKAAASSDSEEKEGEKGDDAKLVLQEQTNAGDGDDDDSDDDYDSDDDDDDDDSDYDSDDSDEDSTDGANDPTVEKKIAADAPKAASNEDGSGEDESKQQDAGQVD
ncbi:hypothetical protein M3Y99_00145400 [Aphelenchoides fujianensis]|nr:hypothetical protein M3Y99_00145400 [Aphelenchoides fujianensis]